MMPFGQLQAECLFMPDLLKTSAERQAPGSFAQFATLNLK